MILFDTNVLLGIATADPGWLSWLPRKGRFPGLPADQIVLPWLSAVGADRFPVFAIKPDEPKSELRKAAELLLGLRLFQSAGVADNESASRNCGARKSFHLSPNHRLGLGRLSA